MKKLITVILLSIVMIPIIGSISYSQTYTITQLTDNNYADIEPRINDNGQLVWVGQPEGPTWIEPSYHEIFFYDGSTITRLTDNDYEDANPRINDNGYAVWQGYDGQDFEIFLYDGSTVIQLTNNESQDVNPQINNDNHVVWRRCYGYRCHCTETGMFLYNGSSTTEIYAPRRCNGAPEMNNIGHVVWNGNDCWGGIICYVGNHGLFLYDGIDTITLTDGGVRPQINDNDYVVWDWGGEIYLYDGSTITQLTYTDYGDLRAQINDNGYVVWEATQDYEEIYLYDGSTIRQITDSQFPAAHMIDKQINNNNYVVWSAQLVSSPYYYKDEIFLYNGSTTLQLTNDGYADYYPQINNNNHVVWSKYIGDWEIFLAIPGIPLNNPPIANAGPDQTVPVGPECLATVTCDGSGSSDPDGDPLTYTWTWDGGEATGETPTIQLPLGTTTITLVVNDGTADSELDTVDITVIDNALPEVKINIPQSGDALQDGVIFTAEATDNCGVARLYFYLREPGDIPIYDDLQATFTSGKWEYDFDTTILPDGNYVLLAKAIDTNENEGWSELVSFSIRNWAVVELLPASKSNKAGRTMPVKFSLRIASSVDPAQPFVRNEELEIRIYNDTNSLLQTSIYGDHSTDYRIDTSGELYITNFKTEKKPATYRVEIWRMSKNFEVGEFTFETVK